MIQRILAYSQRYTTTTTENFPTFSSPQKEICVLMIPRPFSCSCPKVWMKKEPWQFDKSFTPVTYLLLSLRQSGFTMETKNKNNPAS